MPNAIRSRPFKKRKSLLQRLFQARTALFLLRRFPVVSGLILLAGLGAKLLRRRRAEPPVPPSPATSAPATGTSVPPIGSPTVTVAN
jgi:hypothetical protein